MSWIPIVAFNQMFDDIARILFSIPRESDVWWKWLLVFLFGLLIEGMLIASYLIYLNKFKVGPVKNEGFGVGTFSRSSVSSTRTAAPISYQSSVPATLTAAPISYQSSVPAMRTAASVMSTSTSDQKTQNMLDYFKSKETSMTMILFVYSIMDGIKKRYSNNAGILDRLNVFNDNARSIVFDLTRLNDSWNKMKMNPNTVPPSLETQYNLLVSLEEPIRSCENAIKDMQSYGFH